MVRGIGSARVLLFALFAVVGLVGSVRAQYKSWSCSDYWRGASCNGNVNVTYNVGYLTFSGTGSLSGSGATVYLWEKDSVTDITVSSGVNIADFDFGFSAYKNLSKVNLQSNLTSLKGSTSATGMFANCSSLTSVTLPYSLTSIGDFSFSGCRKLTSISIPISVTSIGWGAFSSVL